MARKKQKLEWWYDKSTDVMFFDIAKPKGVVDTFPVANDRFDEDILIEVDRSTGDIVGIRITNWKPFRRHMIRRYRLWKIRTILDRILSKLIESSPAMIHYPAPRIAH